MPIQTAGCDPRESSLPASLSARTGGKAVGSTVQHMSSRGATKRPKGDRAHDGLLHLRFAMTRCPGKRSSRQTLAIGVSKAASAPHQRRAPGELAVEFERVLGPTLERCVIDVDK